MWYVSKHAELARGNLNSISKGGRRDRVENSVLVPNIIRLCRLCGQNASARLQHMLHLQMHLQQNSSRKQSHIPAQMPMLLGCGSAAGAVHFAAVPAFSVLAMSRTCLTPAIRNTSPKKSSAHKTFHKRAVQASD